MKETGPNLNGGQREGSTAPGVASAGVAGFSQLRESAYLYGPDPLVPLAHVRLFEHMDDSGRWEIRLHSPASARPEIAEWDGEDAEKLARAELARIYADGEQDGTWKISKRDRH